METYTKAQLEKLNFYDVRNVARAVGVKNVSKKKISVLIDNIIKIQDGELAPYRTKKGRPVKKRLNYNEIDRTEDDKAKILELKLLAKRMLEIIASL